MSSSLVLKNYISDTDWNVGALFAHDGFIFRLHKVCKELNITFPIKYVFGGLSCCFQGGRVAPYSLSMSEAEDIVKRYNDLGIFCRLTFSNYNISESDLNDEVGNKLLEMLNRVEGNGVIVSSDLLADYIRKNYPNLQLISSQVKVSTETVLGETDTPEYYNNLFDRYDIVVMNPARSNDLDFLGKISYPDRVEFIANHRCSSNCSMAKKHYELMAEIDRLADISTDREHDKLLNEKNEEIKKLIALCNQRHLDNPLDNVLLSTGEINKLVELGFKHFKLEGRDYNGVTVMRDIGQWLFNPDGPYLGILRAVQGGNI